MDTHRVSTTRPITLFASLLAAGALLVTLSPGEAQACGGTFCARPTPMSPRPEPVDQNAERIAFVMHGDNTVSAHVWISYVGSADSFAWVVPIPGVPSVTESSQAFFEALDQASALDVTLPAPVNCTPTGFTGGFNDFGDGGGDGFACGGSDSSTSGAESCAGSFCAGEPQPQEAPVPFADDPVTVYDVDSTDNYEFAIIGAQRADDLVTWLQDNGYNVSENMVPAMQPYIGPAMRFLALKLRDGKQATDIVPVNIRYAGREPMIPIQLTAVAAQPYMGIQVFILADEPYVPRNFDSVPINQHELIYDGSGRINYFEWVAREVEESGGHRFVTEYIGDHRLPANVGGVTVEQPILSRFYTRMSPEHMTRDPTFRVASDRFLRVSNQINLTQQASLFTCDDNLNLVAISSREPSACAFNYCGPGATCYDDDGRVGCFCPEGRVAQEISGPDGNRRVVCTPAENPLAVTDEDAGKDTPFDPCASYVCGDGECVLKGGFPTCACAPGAVAHLADGQMTCSPFSPLAIQAGPGAGVEAAGDGRAGIGGEPVEPEEEADTPDEGSGLPLLWLPLALGLGLGAGQLGRRRRHGQGCATPSEPSDHL